MATLKTVFVAAAAVCLLLFLSQVAGQDKPVTENAPPASDENEKFDFWMTVKLVESQRLFAALVQEDYPTITSSSERLKTVSSLEGFVRQKTPGYRTQLKTFEFSVDEILQQAENENIEGVTLGFQQLTLSCVNCHKQLRQ